MSGSESTGRCGTNMRATVYHRRRITIGPKAALYGCERSGRGEADGEDRTDAADGAVAAETGRTRRADNKFRCTDFLCVSAGNKSSLRVFLLCVGFVQERMTAFKKDRSQHRSRNVRDGSVR